MSEQESATATGYDALSAEQNWYPRWESAGLFSPHTDPEAPLYTITIPPPNITGSLHMGHALCYSIQDLLGRYHRMRGHRVLILPGQDHAGIATQSLVGKNLKKQGIDPVAIGRDAFIEKVWEWRHESGNTILEQFRALGCAFDWSRLRFTLDEGYTEAVHKVFIDWFERGLIYRGMRVVNWDPILKTSVSDIETERKDIQGKLYHIRYPFADGSGEVIIATTRPETMLADVAVAVHPSDKRYDGLIGKELQLPLTDRLVPLISDEYPDPEFGTGAVKITPAHDPNDFEVGTRHNLPLLRMLDETGKVTELGGIYAGLDRAEARKRVVADLEEQGFLVKIEDHTIPILISQRSGEIVEPLASEQWFVNQRTLAVRAIQVVESGEIVFFPPRFKDVYLDWMNNIRDWCISRQLWWGHRIPIYYTEDGTPFAATSWEEAQSKAGEAKIVRQEDDVLDTWFSSGLWPFATLGWPESTEDLKTFYPTNVLVTARDIIYLWVARMIMMGLDLVDEIPFKHVYIYATVLTKDGKRMSKSLGTGIDPMDVISTKGADVLRYTLLAQTGTNQDLRYSEERTTDARNFCNKVWNASRFVAMNLDGYTPGPLDQLEDFDRWILNRLAECEKTVSQAYETYEMQDALGALYRFFWSELCDWYIEVSKSRLQNPQTRAIPQRVLVKCLHDFLRMLHPALPFVSEEVYEMLPIPGKQPFLMAETWPSDLTAWWDPAIDSKIENWLEATRGLRALRAEFGLAAMRSIPKVYFEGALHGGEQVVASQAWVQELVPGKPEGQKFVSTTVAGLDFHLPLEGVVDTEKELARLDREITKVNEELGKLNQRLQSPAFVERAKPEVVERERAAAQALEDKITKLRERLALFSS